MIIRAANPTDAPSIIRLQNPIIRDTLATFNAAEKTADDIIQQISTVKCFLVAETEGNLCGFALYDQFRKGVGYARTMEHTVIVAPDASGMGVGRALMAEVENHARSAGVGSLWAGVSAENPAGVAFHASIGFVQVTTLEKVGFKFGRWIDLILMRKWLDPEGDVAASDD